MSNISTEELEQKIAAGEEVIDRYFDPATARVGTPRVMTSRRGQEQKLRDLNIPDSMLNELDQMAIELNISCEAVIKMMLRRALDEHYLAKRSVS
ncbi:MAG: CopG family transcriptional regulator [Leptolyngbyaceae cyanobacterium SU_3_3]|nr:CopG family transcriptional regulator [Leptolyngbyaceae cyanobacterium SU_3_3]